MIQSWWFKTFEKFWHCYWNIRDTHLQGWGRWENWCASSEIVQRFRRCTRSHSRAGRFPGNMRNKDLKIILCRHGQVFSVADPDMLIAFLAEQSFYFPQKIQHCRRCTWRRWRADRCNSRLQIYSIIRHFLTNIIRRDNKGKVITLDMLIISRNKQSFFFFKRKNVQGGRRCKHRDFVPIAPQATFLCSWFKLKNISWEASHPSTF